MPAFAGGVNWPTFIDETDVRLVASPSVGASNPDEKDYAWGDVDQDGDVDLVAVYKEPFTTPGRRRNVLFMNEGGVLVDRTQEYATAADDGGDGFLDLTNDRDVALVDVDGDGWLDIVTAVACNGCAGLPKTITHPRIYVNLKDDPPGSGQWQGFRYEEARFPQMAAPFNFCGVGFGDVTGDDAPDLYFTDYDSIDTIFENRLLVNDGNGFFTDETTLRTFPEMNTSNFSVTAVIADMNVDGVNDIVIDHALSPYHTSIAYNNPQDEGFFDQFDYDVLPNSSAYFVSVGELNNDGLLDIILTTDGQDGYLLNQGNDANGHADFLTFILPNSWGFGGNNVIADINDDGFMDIVVAQVDVDVAGCTGLTKFYRNNAEPPNVSFVEDNGGIPSEMRSGGHDVAIFDIDGDGWLDIVHGRCTGTQVYINQPAIELIFTYPDGLPDVLPVDQASEFQVIITGINGDPAPATGVMHYSVNGGLFTDVPMEELGAGIYAAPLPAANCLDKVEFYLTAEHNSGGVFADPPLGPEDPYFVIVAAAIEVSFEDGIEGDVTAWTIVSDPSLTTGEWEQAVPIGTTWGSHVVAPFADAEPEPGHVMAFVTENGLPGGGANDADVDGGPTDLISPTIDLEASNAEISYSRWFYRNPGSDDVLEISITNDGDSFDPAWVVVENVTGTNAGPGTEWQSTSFNVAEFVEPTAQIKMRFRTNDGGSISITEAAVDDIQVLEFVCAEDVISIISSNPPDGSIDARQPSEPDGSNEAGWDGIVLTFGNDASGVSIDDFTIESDPDPDAAPVIDSIEIAGNTAALAFSSIIPAKNWTIVTHVASGTSARIGFLPGDVNNDGLSNANDVLALIDILNGVVDPPPEYQTDTDRSGQTNPSDVLRVIDLLNGAGVYEAFNGASLPD